jgi:hypothetical protein
MNGATKTLVGNSKTLNNLQISGNTTAQTSHTYINGTLTVDNLITLTISDYVYMNDGSTTTLASGSPGGTIGGAGYFYIKGTAANNLSTTGTLSVPTYFDLSTNNATIPARIYGYVRTTNSTATVDRTATMGAGTFTFSSLAVGSSVAHSVILDATAHNPTVNITGGLTFITNNGGTPSISMYNSTSPNPWTVGSTLALSGGSINMGTTTVTCSMDVNLTGGTITPGTSTLIMNGSGRTLAPNGQSLNNFEVAGNTTLGGTLTTTGYVKIDSGKTLTATSQTLNIAGDFNNAGGTLTSTGSTVNLTGADSSNQNVHGSTGFNNLGISTAGNGAGRTITFDGSSTQTIASLALTGANGKVLTLQSSNSSNWTINPTAVTSSTYLNVSHSTNSGVAFCATYSTHDTPNTNTSWQISRGAACAAPTAPSGFTGTAASTSQINWSWTNNDDNADYYVVKDAGGVEKSSHLAVGTTTFNETSGLSANTSYSRHVTAVNDFGSSDSNAVSKYTWIETPTGITASANANTTEIDLSVTNSLSNLAAGSSGIQFAETTGHLGGGGEGCFSDGSPGWTNVNSCADTGLSPNILYTYTVTARNGDGVTTSTYSSQSKYTLAAAPGDPTATAQSWSAGNGNAINITLAANGNPNGTLYETYYDTNPAGTFVTTVQTFTAHNDGDSIAHNNLTADQTYYYKVKAKNGDGVVTGYNPASPPVSALTAPAQVALGPSHNGVTGHTANTTTSITWAWTQNATAPDGYNIYPYSSSTCQTGQPAVVTVTGSPPAGSGTESSGLAADTSYARCIQAYRGAITGQPSTNFSAYTSANDPVSLSDSSITTTGINWNWASGGAQKDFYASDLTGNSGYIAGTSWNASSGHSANTQYTLSVYARNGDNDHGSTVTVAKYTAIETPTGISETAITTTEIDLSVTNSLSNLLVGSSGIQFAETTGYSGGGGQSCFSDGSPGWTQTNACADTGLLANTLYTYTATARNGDGVVTSTFSSQSFTTTANPPTMATPTITNNTTGTSVTLNGNITDTGGANATERGFKVYTSVDCSGGSMMNPHDSGSYGTGAFSKASDVALTANTTYHFTAYAINPGGTGTSSCQSFTTPTSPTVTVSAADGISATAATLHGNITSVGAGTPADNVNPTERGFKVYTNNTCTSTILQNPHENNYSGGYSAGVYSLATTDALSPHTDYWYTAYAISTVGMGTSASCQKFTTIDTTITMSAQAATAVTETSAAMNGTLVSAGGVNVTQLGFNLYSSDQNCGGAPTESHQTGSYGDNTVYNLPASSLTPNTYYSYKSYGLDSGGNEVDSPTCQFFLTLANVPSAVTVVTQSWDGTGNPATVTIHSNSNPDTTAYYIQAQEIAGTETATDAQNTCNTTNNWFQIGGGDGWNVRADGSSFTDYRTADIYVCYRLKARNAVKTETDYSSTSVVEMTAPAQPTWAAGVTNYAPTIATNSITWAWNTNTISPDGYRLFNASTNDQVCADTATTGCTQTQSSPGSNLQTNVSYLVNLEGFRGGITGQPSSNVSAFTAIEAVSGVTWGAFTTTSLSATPTNSFSNLTAYGSGLRYCNTTTSVCSAWQQNPGSWTSSSLGINTQNTLTIQSRNGNSRTTTAASAQKYTRANPPSNAGHNVTNLSTTQIEWTWSANSNPGGTTFCVNDDSYCTTATTLDQNDPTRLPNTQYTVNIYAKNGDGVRSDDIGNPVNTSAYTAIESPSGVTSGLITPNSIALNMTGSFTNLNLGLSGLEFVKDPANDGGGTGAGFTTWTASQSTVDTGLSSNQTYKYSAQARNAEGVMAGPSAESIFNTTSGTQLLLRLPNQSFTNGTGVTGPPQDQYAGTPFALRVYATDANNYQDLNYTHVITLSSTAGQADMPQPAAMVGGIEDTTITVYSAGSYTLTGLGSGGTSAPFTVLPSTCSATVSTATASPTTLNTGSASTVTITLTDAYGNRLANHEVSVSSNQGSDIITISRFSTDSNGQILATIRSGSAHVSNITISDITDGVTLDTQPQITFNATALDKPTNFAVQAGDAKVDLAWTNPSSPSFSKVNIYRTTTSGELGTRLQSTSGQSYTDSGLTNGTVYFYTLRAADAAGNESLSTDQLSAKPASAKLTDSQPPSVATNLRALELGSTSLTITWDPSTDNVGVAGYQVYNSDTQILIGVTTGLTDNFANLTPLTTYHFYVRSYDAAGNFSPFSTILDITTLKNQAGVAGGETAAYLVMSNVPDVVTVNQHFSDVKITVADAGGKLITSYNKAIFFASTDPNAQLPFTQDNPYTFTAQDAGVHEFTNNEFAFKTAGSQKLTVSDSTLNSFKDVTVNSNVTLTQAASKVRDFFGKATNVSKVNTGVVVTSAAVLLAPIAINSAVSASSILPQLIYWFIQLLQAVGVRKRRKSWGLVYNSQTGQPVPLAIVKIFERRYNRVLEQMVTDAQGRYGFLTKPGEFYLTVSKAGFSFPPKEKTSSFYEKVYIGGPLKISAKNQSVAFNIPLDPTTGPQLSGRILVGLIRANKVLQKVRLPLLILGTIFAAVMIFVSYNIVYVLSLIFYFLIIALEILRGRKARPYGSVTDVFGHPLDLAIVRIYHKSTNRLIETDVSDSQGRFKFLVNPGVYYLTATKPGFLDFKSHLMYLEKERTLVSSTIKLKKVE